MLQQEVRAGTPRYPHCILMTGCSMSSTVFCRGVNRLLSDVSQLLQKVRKEQKKKMFKQNARGQPLMKHRMESILEKLTG